ncbi:hypothetical protein [Microbacterium gorillae]|uniref:hypothetical protein n=1 Tax=Microbacterium gorillae TaxID=1231063 RepID=UPI001143BB97|nr:hypothetical protein [Microbacterium gorillae]
MSDRDATPTRRALRAGGRRDRHRRQRRGLVIAILGVLGTTVLGLGAAGGTYAMLTATADIGGQSAITAGTAALTINGTASGATLAAVAPAPATPKRVAFQVSNTGDVALALSSTIAVTAPAPAIVGVTRAIVAPVADAAACAAGPAGTPAAINGHTVPTLATLPAGATAWYCLEVSIAPGSSAALAGQDLTYRLTIDGRQTAP